MPAVVLADRDAYHTPPDAKPGLLARVAPAVAFYLPVLRIVFRASREASRGLYDGARWAESSLAILTAMEAAGMCLTVEGMGVLRAFDGPAVFVANHMSTLETFVLPCLIQPVKPVTFVVKEDLVRYPVFGHVMRSRDPITVGRANPREDLAAVLQGGEERLRRGVSIVVFPQGTRFPEVAPEQFNSLGAKLAARAGVPLVPVALDSLAWGTGRLLKDFGRIDPTRPVRFRFGEPLFPRGKGAENHEAAVRFIVETVRGWRRAEQPPRPGR